jgi:glutamate formiminotransferase/formiminotetrahydrofolate cyclodeaminase
VTALADQPLGRLLEDVAAATPSPGGGSTCGVTCALAAGLAEMAAAFTLTREEYAERHARMREIAPRAGALRAEALGLAEADLSVYGAVLEALREPAEAPGRAERLDAALSAAADTPLAIARAAAEVAELAAEVAQVGNRHLHGDAAAGALLAEAACAAAAHLVELNLAEQPNDPRREELKGFVARAGKVRLQALAGAPTAHDV